MKTPRSGPMLAVLLALLFTPGLLAQSIAPAGMRLTARADVSVQYGVSAPLVDDDQVLPGEPVTAVFQRPQVSLAGTEVETFLNHFPLGVFPSETLLITLEADADASASSISNATADLTYHLTIDVPSHPDESVYLGGLVLTNTQAVFGTAAADWKILVDGKLFAEGSHGGTTPGATEILDPFCLPPSKQNEGNEIRFEVTLSAVAAIEEVKTNVALSLSATPLAVPATRRVRVSFTEIQGPGGSPQGYWSADKAQLLLDKVNTIYERCAGIRFEFAKNAEEEDDYKSIRNPNVVYLGLPQQFPQQRSWFDIRMSVVAGAEELELTAEQWPTWRVDAVNVILVNSIFDRVTGRSYGGWAHPPGGWNGCSALRNDLVLLAAPRSLLGDPDDRVALALAHEFGHYLDLLHTFDDGNYCSCPTGMGDCVADLEQDVDTEKATRAESKAELERVKPEYTEYQVEQLLDNLMSYHPERTIDSVKLSCGQVERLQRALQHPDRFWILAGRTPPGLSTAAPAITSYPGPTSVTLGGNNLPPGLGVRIGEQAAVASGSGSSISVTFPRPIEPGNHAAELFSLFRLVGYLPDAVQVTPWCDWAISPPAAGNALDLILRSTTPATPMVALIGVAIPPVALPGVGYLLKVSPLIALPTVTDASGSARVTFPMGAMPRRMFAELQAIEIQGGLLGTFSNARTLGWR